MPDYRAKVNMLFELGRYAEAERELRAVLAQSPDEALAHAMLAAAISSLNRFPEALRESKTAIALDPTLAYAFYAQGLVLMRWGRRRGAIRAMREAIRLDPQNPEPLYVLAWLISRRHHWNQALRAVDRALALDPRHVASLALRGELLHHLGRWEESKQAYDSALAIDPESADAHHGRGALLLAAAIPQAADHLLEARRLEPLTRNDGERIALAVGRRTWPFRWLRPLVVRWNLWPTKRCWAAFLLIMAICCALYRPMVPTLHADRGKVVYDGGPAYLAFAAVIMALFWLPFTFDVAAASVGDLIESLQRHRRTPLVARLEASIGVVLLAGIMLFAEVLLMCFALIPAVTMIICGCGACPTLVAALYRSGKSLRPALLVYVPFALMLLLALLGPASEWSLGWTWASIAAFAVPSFFADTLVRALRRWD